MNHSKEVWKFGNELDHLGIVLVIWSSSFCSAYFGFYCDLKLQISYCALVMASILQRCCRLILPMTGHDQRTWMWYINHAAPFPNAIVPCNAIGFICSPWTLSLHSCGARYSLEWLGASEPTRLHRLFHRSCSIKCYWYGDLRCSHS